MIHVAGDPLKGANGKPEIFYYGAEYCPYCAAERWSLIMAMSRFGEYKDLRLMKSADAPEAFPDEHLHLPAQHVYQPVRGLGECRDRRPHGAPLQTPTSDQLAIVNKYDAPPYTDQRGPFRSSPTPTSTSPSARDSRIAQFRTSPGRRSPRS